MTSKTTPRDLATLQRASTSGGVTIYDAYGDAYTLDAVNHKIVTSRGIVILMDAAETAKAATVMEASPPPLS